MSEEPNSIPVGRLVRDLLAQDRSLSPTERKVLEVLLLHPPPTTARDLSRATGTNLQALYGALERLTSRGLAVAERTGTTARFRVAHPSVVLQALVEPGVRASELARQLEAPLRGLYEQDDLSGLEDVSTHARSTSSPTAAASWLMDLVGSASSEVWILGNDAPWFASGAALEAELQKSGDRSPGRQVRLLVPAPPPDEPPSDRHGRLKRSGVDVRYSGRFASPAVVVDRRWMMIQSGTEGRPRPVYLRLEAPALCQDLVVAAEEAWRGAETGTPGVEAGSPGPSNGARRGSRQRAR
jgi:hypothetical protein